MEGRTAAAALWVQAYSGTLEINWFEFWVGVFLGCVLLLGVGGYVLYVYRREQDE